MRIGYCTNLIASQPDGLGGEWIEPGQECGFAYVELPLAQVMALSDGEFSSMKRRLDSSGIRCEACNNFLPGHIRVTGDAVDRQAIEHYLDGALERAAFLGAEVIVFGSPRSRNVPDGFPEEEAWSQLVDFLRLVEPRAAAMEVTVVIEPICRLEGNIVTTVRDGHRLCREVNREHVRLLADFYHMAIEEEDPETLLTAGPDIRHVHFADPVGRIYPREPRTEIIEFLTLLKHTGYDGRVSVEAMSTAFRADGRRAVELLKRLVK